MSQLKLEFSAVKGEQAAIGINAGTKNVDLTSREVLAIDLSPLELCLQLQQITLSWNWISICYGILTSSHYRILEG